MGVTSDNGAIVAVALLLGFFAFVFAIAFYVLSAWFLMKIFDKAGVQGRWRAWVPVYNFMVFAKLGDLSPWVMLIAIGAAALLGQVPAIGWIIALLPIVVSALAAWRVGLKLQKEPVWVVLYVPLTIVWLGINAFDKSRWNPNVPPAPWASNGFFADRTAWDGVPVQPNAAASGYQPPADYQPPAGYQPPPAPAGYQPPAPPAGYQPPAPPIYQPPAPPVAQPPAPAATPPVAEPPATPTAPPTTEPPAAEPGPGEPRA